MVYVLIRTSLLAAAAVVFLSSSSWAACTGQFAPGQACGNATSGAKDPTGVGISPLLDRAFGAPSAQGSVLNRGAGSWSSTITPILGNPGTTTGTIGLGSITGGTATIVPPAIIGNTTLQLPSTAGTIPTTALSPIILDSVTGVMSCPTCITNTELTVNTTPVSGALAGQVLFSDGSLLQAYPITGTGSVVLSNSPTFTGTPDLATPVASSLSLGGAVIGGNSLAVTGPAQFNSSLIYGGVTLNNSVTGTGSMVLSSSPTFTGTPVLSTSTATSINGLAITPTTGTFTLTNGKTLSSSNSISLAGTDGTTWTGPEVNASLAALNIGNQLITGGADVTTLAQATGNLTVNCGARPTQSITNGGAFTITADNADGYCVLLVTNNASAGVITFSGFTVGANTGDLLTPVNGNRFMVFFYRVNAVSTFSIKALQ